MLLFCDSFDTYATLTQKYDSVTTSVGSVTINSGAARTGANGLLCFANIYAYVTKNFSSRATYIAGFAINCNSIASGPVNVFVLLDTGTVQFVLKIDSAGNIKAYRGGTLLGTASSTISPLNAYHHLEVKVTIHGSSGVVSVQLDGVNVLNLTGQNTQVTGNASANQVQLGADNGNTGSDTIYFDDFYICDNSGSLNNTFLGDVSMLARTPSANGTQNDYTATFASFINGHTYVVGETFKDSNNSVQRCTVAGTAAGSAPTWATTGGLTTTSGGATFVVVGSGSNPGAANWMAVSETVPDDNSSYVTDATVGHIDRYTYPSIGGSSVKAAVLNLRGEKDDASTRSIRAVTKSGGTTADNGSDFGLTLNTYANFQGIFETDPNSGIAWTVAGVNAAEFGVKTTA
jgi:hypothetical protein